MGELFIISTCTNSLKWYKVQAQFYHFLWELGLTLKTFIALMELKKLQLCGKALKPQNYLFLDAFSLLFMKIWLTSPTLNMFNDFFLLFSFIEKCLNLPGFVLKSQELYFVKGTIKVAWGFAFKSDFHITKRILRNWMLLLSLVF